MNKQFFFLDNKKHLKLVADLLNQGHVVAGVSDTVLGLLATVNTQGKSALDAIKNREAKPYIILIGDSKKLENFTDNVNKDCQKLIKNCWPGPLTIIVKTKPEKRDFLGDTVALRVPKHEGLLNLLENISALYSTSANIAGQQTPHSIEDLDKQILEGVSGIICNSYDNCTLPATQPSTIIDCTGTQLKVVREGAYSVEHLSTICSCVIKK